MMLSEPPVVKKPAASSGAWKSDKPIATISSSICFRPKNARLPPSAFSVKNSRNASRPSAAISSLALKTYRGARPRRQSMSLAESAFIRSKISARERPTDGSALRMKWRAERPEQRRHVTKCPSFRELARLVARRPAAIVHEGIVAESKVHDPGAAAETSRTPEFLEGNCRLPGARGPHRSRLGEKRRPADPSASTRPPGFGLRL